MSGRPLANAGDDLLAGVDYRDPRLFQICSEFAWDMIDLGTGSNIHSVASHSVLTAALVNSVLMAARAGRIAKTSDCRRLLRGTDAVAKRAMSQRRTHDHREI
jgi:hypothetical protein